MYVILIRQHVSTNPGHLQVTQHNKKWEHYNRVKMCVKLTDISVLQFI